MAIARTVALGVSLIVALSIGADSAYASIVNIHSPIVPTHVALPTKQTITVIKSGSGSGNRGPGRAHGPGGGHHPGCAPWVNPCP